MLPCLLPNAVPIVLGRLFLAHQRHPLHGRHRTTLRIARVVRPLEYEFYDIYFHFFTL